MWLRFAYLLPKFSVIYCNREDSLESLFHVSFLPLGFVFTTLYTCLTTYSGGEDESMDCDLNQYPVLAIVGAGGLPGMVACQST
ncbi:hypothetical protein DXV24_11570 [Escherichia albertii]|nr:hypothetical protein [Escherichia albertii]